MEKLLKIASLLVLVSLFLGADTTGTTAALETTIAQVLTDHYRIFYEGTEQSAQTFSVKMEACLELYNSVLHFDLTKLTVKLKIRVFSNKTGFDAYLKTIIKE